MGQPLKEELLEKRATRYLRQQSLHPVKELGWLPIKQLLELTLSGGNHLLCELLIIVPISLGS